MENRKEIDASFIALLSTLLFALQFPIIKLSYNYISSQQAIFLEALFAIIFSLALFWVRGQKFKIHFSIPILGAAICNSIGLICLFEALTTVHPATVGFLGRLYFIYAVALGVLVLKERQSKKEYALIFATIVGVFLISFDNQGLSLSGPWIGTALGIAYPFFFAAQNVLVKKIVKNVSSQEILISTKVSSLLPLGIYLFVSLGHESLNLNLYGTSLIGMSTLFSTFLGLLLMYKALSKGSFITVNLMKTFQPIFVVIISLFLFPKELDIKFWIGASLIIIPACLVIIIKKDK